MPTNSKSPQHLTIIGSRSSLFTKLNPDDRRGLDQAIIDRDPPTYRAAFEKFRLADRGISFSAFHQYARRLRSDADHLRTAHLALPEPQKLRERIHLVISQRFLEAAEDEQTSHQALARLALAFRIVNDAVLHARSPAARKANPLTDPADPRFDQFQRIVRNLLDGGTAEPGGAARARVEPSPLVQSRNPNPEGLESPIELR